MAEESTHEKVKEFYGKRVKTTEDLISNACCIGRLGITSEAKEALKLIHPEVSSK